MEKKNVEMKRWLILIIVILIGYWIANNLSVLVDFFKLIGNILSPFILGGCLAFILNIPMSFFEKNYQKLRRERGRK